MSSTSERPVSNPELLCPDMKLRLLLSLTLILLISAREAQPATITYLPISTTVSAGSSFTVQIFGSSINDISGYSLYLNSSAGAGLLQITGQTLNTSLFTYGGPAPTFPEPISTTQTSQDLGAFSLSDLPTGSSYLLSTATISVGAAASPGNYQIGNTAATVFTDPTFTEADFAPVNTFAITVVPEPEVGGMVILGVTSYFTGVRRRRVTLL